MKTEDIRKHDVYVRYIDIVQEDVKRFFSSESPMEKVDCPASGSQEHVVEFEKIGFTYVMCKNCSTLFVNPRPSFETLKQFYMESKSDSFWINEFFKPVANARREKIFKPRAQYLVGRFGHNQKWTIGDIGAGFGIFIEELSRFWTNSHFIAIEPSRKQADICRKKGIEVKCCFLEEVKEYKSKISIEATSRVG